MKKVKVILGVLVAASFAVSCKNAPTEEVALSGLKRADFQAEIRGKKTDLFTLRNANGMEVCLTNFGGRMVSIMVPDKEGNMKDVLVGQKTINDYNTYASDFGATIGRYANRINQGKITLDGVEYQLPKNNYGHCLHGGCTLDGKGVGPEGANWEVPMGWQYSVMDVENVTDTCITFVNVSPDGEAGFPGTVVAKTTYTLTPCNAIDIVWKATTDKKTVINMCNHAYFNLNGDYATPITNHMMALNADFFTPVDATFMTTGEIAPVEGTPMDFRTPKAIGQDIEKYDYEQLKNGNGYDHNWVLNTKGCDKCPVAQVVSPLSGIRLTVFTNEPGIQVYTGNFLDGTVNGKDGKPIQFRTAVCLETQHFPDSPNKGNLEGWYSCELNPGEEYYSHCVYQFSTCGGCGKEEGCSGEKDCCKDDKAACCKEKPACDKMEGCDGEKECCEKAAK
ncbi:MAG: galactose mutarotase [Bacteroidaceae bacterium]|nr:galactose mutarotase [Bacteroidaceae bacterium]